MHWFGGGNASISKELTIAAACCSPQQLHDYVARLEVLKSSTKGETDNSVVLCKHFYLLFTVRPLSCTVHLSVVCMIRVEQRTACVCVLYECNHFFALPAFPFPLLSASGSGSMISAGKATGS